MRKKVSAGDKPPKRVNTTQVNISLPNEIVARLKELSIKHDRSVSNLILRAIKKAMAEDVGGPETA